MREVVCGLVIGLVCGMASGAAFVKLLLDNGQEADDDE